MESVRPDKGEVVIQDEELDEEERIDEKALGAKENDP